MLSTDRLCVRWSLPFSGVVIRIEYKNSNIKAKPNKQFLGACFNVFNPYVSIHNELYFCPQKLENYLIISYLYSI